MASLYITTDIRYGVSKVKYTYMEFLYIQVFHEGYYKWETFLFKDFAKYNVIMITSLAKQ